MIHYLIVALGAFFGTVAFSLLFHVPKKYYPACGAIGMVGYVFYLVLTERTSVAVACFFATLLIVLLSRFCAVREQCPVTIFLISGIFPLVPGAGIYWTAYYAIVGDSALCYAKGLESVKIAVAIVLGIVFVFELPQKVFLPRKKRA